MNPGAEGKIGWLYFELLRLPPLPIRTKRPAMILLRKVLVDVLCVIPIIHHFVDSNLGRR